MRLLFICSCLETGKDGVGDYVRRLAEHLRSLGNEIILVSLNDRLLVHDKQIIQSTTIRLSACLSWSRRLRTLKKLCSSFNPDYISLQYVPYGFSKSGLPWMLPVQLSRIDTSAKWHLMFHELWIGITRSSPWKHKAVGLLQRYIVKALVSCLHPTAIHTTNPLYVYLLRRAHINSKRLPLFSSIQSNRIQLPWATNELKKMGISAADRQSWFVVGMFGSCYPDFPLEAQLHHAFAIAKLAGKKLAVIGVGGGVGTGIAWEQRVREAVPLAMVKYFGRQDEGRISALLSSLDMGLPSTPVEFLGKSSVAAAMAEHCALVDTSYSVDLPEYRHLRLSEWKIGSLFWSLEEVAQELQRSFV